MVIGFTLLRRLASFAALFAAPWVCTAAVLVSNIEQPTRSTTEISSTLWAAQAFSTDPSSYRLDSIDLVLGNRVGLSPVVAELRSDVSGPGVLLATFTLASLSAGSPVVVTLSPDSLVNLAPASTYWVVMGLGGTGAFGWSYAEGNASVGPGSLGAYAYSVDAGAAWGSVGTDNPYHLRVEVTPIPEPTSALLVLAGLVVLRRYAGRSATTAPLGG